MLDQITNNPIIQEDIEKISRSEFPWDELDQKKVLITGSTGLIGGYLFLALVLATSRRNLDVSFTVVCRDEQKFRAKFATLLRHRQVRIIVSDLSGPLPNDVLYDYVFHCASHCSSALYGTDPIGVLTPNTIGTNALLELCSPTGHFVFLSSAEVCGLITKIPTPENHYNYFDPTDIRSCYGEGKRVGEAMCAAWSHQKGIHAVILRLFHTYGPGMTLGDGRVFSDFVKDALNGCPIRINSNGRATRSYCYVADAVSGILTALFKGESAKAYNLGNPDGELSVLELANIISELSHKRGVVFREPNTSIGYLRSPWERSRPDINSLIALGWHPEIQPEIGFLRTIKSYEQEAIS